MNNTKAEAKSGVVENIMPRKCELSQTEAKGFEMWIDLGRLCKMMAVAVRGGAVG